MKNIKNIGQYTYEKWGRSQRDLYLDTLDKTIDGLVKSRRLDKNRNNIKHGLLSCFCQEHMIFFKRNDVGYIEVLRVLGQSMDFERHL
ncbi:MAG: type II toxin-antitoxin system RelE/ParE family toxin [Candidatus Puniceispirillales bacterium WSBS_2018_MAG_OTU23]